LYQRVDSLKGSRFAAGVLLFYCLAAAAGLRMFQVWIPVGPLVLAQVSQFGLALLFKTRTTNSALNEMRLHLLRQVKERCFPENFFFSTTYWNHLVALVGQTTPFNRMVFYERIPGTQSLREAKAVHCAFDEVQGRERSLSSEPFREALAKRGPVRLTGFFKPGDSVQEEYLCPLMFSGEVFGMWALGVDPEARAGVVEFETALAGNSRQIARLLHQKQQIAPAPSWLMRLNAWFAAEKEHRTYYHLKSTAGMLEDYHGVLETLLGRMTNAVIVYDYFGRMLYANDSVRTLLQAENVNLTRGTTALELLGFLTGQDEPKVRLILRRVLFEEASVSVSMKLQSQKSREFLLRAYPLSPPEEEQSQPEPYRGQGFVFELIDTSLFSSLSNLKGLVSERLGVELRDHLGAVELSAALLETQSLSPIDQRSVLAAIHQKTSACVHVITECEKYLGRNVDAHAVDLYPLDPLEVLRDTAAQWSATAAERSVTFNIVQPRLMEHVLASKSALNQLFSTILQLLLEDAAENTALNITVEDAFGVSTFRFSNSGFGIPNERLQHLLTSAGVTVSNEFHVLREAMNWVRAWKGSLEISSDVGVGYCVVLRLRQFQMSSLALNAPTLSRA
jgi:signal transduction histidine kinase